MRKNVLLSIYLALAIFLSALETLVLPSSIIPGTKLGIANLVTLVILYQFSIKEVIAVSILRVIGVNLIVGSIFSPTFTISMSGLLVSLVFLITAYKSNLFSVVGVSVCSSVGHIIGQSLGVYFLISLSSIVVIVPYLIYIAIITGVVNGVIAIRILKSVKSNKEVYNEI